MVYQETSETFYRRMMRIQLIDKKRHEGVLRETNSQ